MTTDVIGIPAGSYYTVFLTGSTASSLGVGRARNTIREAYSFFVGEGLTINLRTIGGKSTEWRVGGI